MKTLFIQSIVVAGALCSSPQLMAQQDTLHQSQKIETRINQQAAKSQTAVAASSDNTIQLQNDISALQDEVNNLKVYQTHLQGLIKSQNEEMKSFDTQLSQVDDTKQSVVPLMYAMLDGLASTIKHDRPIKQDSRQKRLLNLQQMMTQANISDAEKYRRILEAYQIELDYGTKLGTYTGKINTDGKTVMTEQLYVGRLSLIARTSDKQSYWAWNEHTHSWQSLSLSMAMQIDKAFDVANKQASPSLIELPVSLNAAKEQK